MYWLNRLSLLIAIENIIRYMPAISSQNYLSYKRARFMAGL